jgi:hypothetical protein
MRLSTIAAMAVLALLPPRPARAQDAPPNAPAVDQARRRAEASAPDAPPASVALEQPEPSQGHFIAVGVHGIGAMAFDADRGTRQPTFGQAVSLRLGESVTGWLSLSLALALGSTHGKERDSLTLVRFGVTSQWYLSERCFVQAGFGATNAQGPDPEDYDLTRGRYGDFYLTGLGYDFYLSDRTQSGGWVFSPIVNADVGPDSKFTTTSLWLGVEVSWWSGLSRDKLELPTPKAYGK